MVHKLKELTSHKETWQWHYFCEPMPIASGPHLLEGETSCHLFATGRMRLL